MCVSVDVSVYFAHPFRELGSGGVTGDEELDGQVQYPRAKKGKGRPGL